MEGIDHPINAIEDLGLAHFQLGDALLVLLEPRGNGGHGAPQLAGPLVERLRICHLLAAGLGQAEQGIGLLLQLITVLHLIEKLLLVLHLAALTLQLLFEPLPQLVQQSQSVAVVRRPLRKQHKLLHNSIVISPYRESAVGVNSFLGR